MQEYLLTIKTDNPEAEVGLLKAGEQLDQIKWTAHRELSNTLLAKINDILKSNNVPLTNLHGIIVYKGPGSFTGLRIGMTVANTLAYAQSIPIVSTTTDKWIELGEQRISAGDDESVASPEYGGEANTTKPKK